jgi:hypothetical protein
MHVAFKVDSYEERQVRQASFMGAMPGGGWRVHHVSRGLR